MADAYSGRDAALIGGGPSFADVDKDALRNSGLLTMTLNNAVVSYKSDLWLGVDAPGRFVRWLWTDPSIQKFTPKRHHGKQIAGEPSLRAGECPNSYFYRQTQWFKREQMFAPHDPSIWDNRNGHGCRTSLMDAIRVLYLLGVRRIYLFGVDFHQSTDKAYHYSKTPNRGGVARNNNLYKRMANRLARLRPLMEEAGLTIFNCNLSSKLMVFDRMHPECVFREFNSTTRIGSIRDCISPRATTKKASTLVIDGMNGLGDNIYSRPFIRAACTRYDQVYLRTPWPQFFWDMQHDYNLRFLRPNTRLRTQNKNMQYLSDGTWSVNPDKSHECKKIRYGQRGFRQGLSILKQMDIALPLRRSVFDFTLPLKPEWVAKADELYDGFNAKRPLAIYRPTTIRREWSAPARNPDNSMVRQVSQWLADHYYVVSIADLKKQEEWIEIPGETPDIAFHRGEVEPGTLAALMQRAALTVTPVGFALPMSLAVGAKVLTLYGGSVRPDLLVDPRINQSSSWKLASTPFCNCTKRFHNCDKRVPPDEISRVLEDIRAEKNKDQQALPHNKFIWWPSKEMGYYPVAQNDMPYDEEYFDKYETLGKTPIGFKLNQFRAELVDRYTSGVVLDYGIGCGTFIETRGPNTTGYDINPHGVSWLKNRQLYVDPYGLECVDSVTCWDTLEHIRYPWALLDKIRKYLFVSMPIYKSKDHVLKSKHFKPNEHYWYFTRDGLVRWLSDAGFNLLEETDYESQLGRECIGTYVFARREPMTVGAQPRDKECVGALHTRCEEA